MNNTFVLRYYYPKISNFESYNKHKSSATQNLQIATKIADEVLCLPTYVELEDKQIIDIVNLLL